METVTTEIHHDIPMLYASIVNTFEVHDFFALERSQVHFFNQSVLPCFHMNGTRVNVNGSVSVSPGGHGDLFHALASSGMLTHMEQLHIEYLFTYNVDNPLAVVADPTYLGFCWHAGSNLCFKTVDHDRDHEHLNSIVPEGMVLDMAAWLDSGNDVLSLSTHRWPTSVITIFRVVTLGTGCLEM